MPLTMGPTTKRVDLTESQIRLLTKVLRKEILAIEKDAEAKMLRSVPTSLGYADMKDLWFKLNAL